MTDLSSPQVQLLRRFYDMQVKVGNAQGFPFEAARDLAEMDDFKALMRAKCIEPYRWVRERPGGSTVVTSPNAFRITPEGWMCAELAVSSMK